ncbi:DUF3150 domain-containing protein [Vibrio alginolyticus]|uniref:DUF3150 domain-containing protein n=1 Tax=Vibrio alginolyticus TaxID=663 RepID=UPI00211A595C|nr:DUF3150 domain-containing protein [Vibrio alginolyticus]
MSKVKHLENLCVINADFDIWSGQTRLSASDFKLGAGGEIPPEKVAQLGSKKICDPAKLKGFHRLKTETRRFLLSYGMPFMNGYAVPVAKTDEICAKLDKIDVEVQQLKHEFVTGYNNAVDEWCRENPEYETAIRAGALSREEVEKRIGFEYQVFMVQPTQDEQSAHRLNRKVEELGDDLIAEVVNDANDFYNKRLAGKMHVATATGATLKNLRDKVDGLSFLNSAFTPLVSLLDQTLAGYEKHGAGKRNIEGMFFFQIMAAVLIMCDRQRIQEYAGGSLSVDDVAKTLTRDELSSLESGASDQEDGEQVNNLEPETILDDFEAFLANRTSSANQDDEEDDALEDKSDVSSQTLWDADLNCDDIPVEDYSQDPADYVGKDFGQSHSNDHVVSQPEQQPTELDDQDCYF